MSVTGLSLITSAFELLNVYQPGDSIASADSQSALGIFNRFLGGLAQQSLTIPAISRETFVLTSGKGGPSNPYTIGIGANLNTLRPPNQQAIAGAAWYVTGTTPIDEVPLWGLTDDEYGGMTAKELAGSAPNSYWYNPTYVVSGFGTLYLSPVPNNALNTLVLYLRKQLGAFADLTTTYELPEGMEGMLVPNLARRLAKPFGVPADQDLIDEATSTLRIFKRSNLKMCELVNYFDGAGYYDIDAGNG